jgi:hypothetical protein
MHGFQLTIENLTWFPRSWDENADTPHMLSRHAVSYMHERICSICNSATSASVRPIELEKGHLYWVGEFAGVFFNDKGKQSLFDHAGVKCPAFNDLDLNKKKGEAAEYCIISDAAGDQAYLTWNCEDHALQEPSWKAWPAYTSHLALRTSVVT